MESSTEEQGSHHEGRQTVAVSGIRAVPPQWPPVNTVVSVERVPTQLRLRTFGGGLVAHTTRRKPRGRIGNVKWLVDLPTENPTHNSGIGIVKGSSSSAPYGATAP